MEDSERVRGLDPAALPAAAFRAPWSVRFSDCDPAGIVYTGRFIDILNATIEDFFPQRLGLDYHAFIRDRRIGLGYAKVACDFFSPAFMGDELTTILVAEKVGRSSAHFSAHIYRGATPILRASLVIVTTSLDGHRAIPLPEPLRAALAAYQESCR